MTNEEFTQALEDLINGAAARGDKQTVVYGQIARAGWRQCKTRQERKRFKREAEKNFKANLRPVLNPEPAAPSGADETPAETQQAAN